MTRTPPRQDGAAIRRLREQRQIETRELAARVGVKLGSLCNVEAGNQQASRMLLYRIARALGVDVAEILTDHGREELAVSA